MAQIALNGNTALVVTIDDADVDVVSKHRWYAHSAGRKVYAKGGPRATGLVLMHRFLTGSPKGFDVDHINGDALDNRRINLRVTSRTVNNLNRPDTRGCYFEARTGTWRVDLWVEKKRIRLGRYKTEDEARAAYLSARSDAIARLTAIELKG